MAFVSPGPRNCQHLFGRFQASVPGTGQLVRVTVHDFSCNVFEFPPVSNRIDVLFTVLSNFWFACPPLSQPALTTTDKERPRPKRWYGGWVLAYGVPRPLGATWPCAAWRRPPLPASIVVLPAAAAAVLL